MLTHRRPLALPALDVQPAHVRVRLGTYLRANQAERIHLIDCGLVLLAAALFQWWPLLFASVLFALPFWVRLRNVKKLVWTASAHAARVVSLDPPFIAYYGDLTKGSIEPQPVVVLQRFEPKRLRFSVQTGDRIAVVSKPVGGDLKIFDHLEARLVSSVNDERRTLQRILDSVPEWEWDELDDALFEIPQPYEAGVRSAVTSRTPSR